MDILSYSKKPGDKIKCRACGEEIAIEEEPAPPPKQPWESQPAQLIASDTASGVQAPALPAAQAGPTTPTATHGAYGTKRVAHPGSATPKCPYCWGKLEPGEVLCPQCSETLGRRRREHLELHGGLFERAYSLKFPGRLDLSLLAIALALAAALGALNFLNSKLKGDGAPKASTLKEALASPGLDRKAAAQAESGRFIANFAIDFRLSSEEGK